MVSAFGQPMDWVLSAPGLISYGWMGSGGWERTKSYDRKHSSVVYCTGTLDMDGDYISTTQFLMILKKKIYGLLEVNDRPNLTLIILSSLLQLNESKLIVFLFLIL